MAIAHWSIIALTGKVRAAKLCLTLRFPFNPQYSSVGVVTVGGATEHKST